MNNLPLIDFKRQSHLLSEELEATVKQVLKQGQFIEGPQVGSLESEFKNCHESSYCIALNSGTAALHTIFKCLEINSADQVIVPSNTCFPTVEAVCMTGATPRFVDCESKYYNIDPEKIEEAITKKTRAIVAVHLYGQSAQMDRITDIAKKHDLLLIEDCAQAHLASYDETMVGNFGLAGAFSFYPTKNLGAYGEGGAVITNEENLAHKIRAFKNHGSYTKNVHEFIGHNYRMDSIQAAILSVKLKYLSEWTQIRQRNAKFYQEYLADLPEIILPKTHPKADHVFHQFVITSSSRDALMKHLNQSGIETAIHYPTPCHLQPVLTYLKHKAGDFPVSEQLAQQALSIPIAEHLDKQDIEKVSTKIREFFN